MAETSGMQPGESRGIPGYSGPIHTDHEAAPAQETLGKKPPPPLRKSSIESAAFQAKINTEQVSAPMSAPLLFKPQGGDKAAEEFSLLLKHFSPKKERIAEEMLSDPEMFSPETAKRIRERLGAGEKKTRASNLELSEAAETTTFSDEEFVEIFSRLLGGAVRGDIFAKMGLQSKEGELPEDSAEGLPKNEDSNSLSHSKEPATNEDFRFTGNYLKVVSQMLAFVNTMKILIATLDSDQYRKLGEVEEENAKELVGLALENLEKNIELREKMKNQGGVGKWILFGLMAVASIAMTVATAGQSALLMGIILAATLTTLTMQAMEMAGVSVTKFLCELCGLDPEKYDWVMKIVVAVALIVGTLGAGAGAYASQAGSVGAFTAKQALATVAVNVVPMAVMSSNMVFEITLHAATGLGDMDEEEAAYLAMALSIIAMIAMIVVSVGVGAKYGLQAVGEAGEVGASATSSGTKSLEKAAASADDLAKNLDEVAQGIEEMSQSASKAQSALSDLAEEVAAESGEVAKTIEEVAAESDTVAKSIEEAAVSSDEITDSIEIAEQGQSVSTEQQQGAPAKGNSQTELQKRIGDFKSRWENMSTQDKILLVERLAQGIQTAGSIAGAISSVRQAILTEIRAELRYDIEVLNALRELMTILQAMFGETREGIVKDMENGIFKFSAELHQMFEKMVSDAGKIVGDAGRALR